VHLPATCRKFGFGGETLVSTISVTSCTSSCLFTRPVFCRLLFSKIEEADQTPLTVEISYPVVPI
jgi:hypothetical protein